MDWGLELAKQVPNLVVLAWMVNRFIGCLDQIHKREEAQATRTDKVIEDNSKALGHCAAVVERCERTLSNIEKGD